MVQSSSAPLDTANSFSPARFRADHDRVAGTAVFLARQFLDFRASRHRTAIANVLHFIALASFAHQGFETSDLLVTILVMVTFDVFQRALGFEAAGTTTGGESEQHHQAPSAIETHPNEERTALTNVNCADQSGTTIVEPGCLGPILASQTGVPDTKTPAPVSKDREIVRLQLILTEVNTANKAKGAQLRVTKEELKNAREALNETFAECSRLREELKTVKQALGRDHQAIVYRKDIELFALRKGNEQKEKYIGERDTKIEDMHREHKATIEVKDAQLKLLKERITVLNRKSSPTFDDAMENGDHALEVRLLRVKKGRKSSGSEDEKDAIIGQLQEKLATATKAAEAVVNQQAELQRAWGIAKKTKNTLKEEREQHAQTREQLQEATVKLTEGEGVRVAQASAGRLPTIDEDEHDKNELELMFDAAQEDNLRLYAELEALEQRVRDANSRMFTAEQNAKALREQVRLEKAVNQDMETARPSVVHRVHFQRMEGQLKETRDALEAKDEEIDLLKKKLAEKDLYVRDLQAEVDAAVKFHTQDQDEIERLKRSVVELQATKEQLTHDHEELASHRTRQRISSADRTSARSSGATLIQEFSPQLTRPSDERSPIQALPPMPDTPMSENEARQEDTRGIPKHHNSTGTASNPNANRWTLMSSDVPPPEFREVKHTRRKSLGLKEMLRKIVKRDSDHNSVQSEDTRPGKNDASRVRHALAPKDNNASLRPATASVVELIDTTPDPLSKPAKSTNSQNMRPPNSRKNTPRYYALQQVEQPERPQTMTGEEGARPTSRGSWAATKKLQRRSLY